MVIGFHNLTYDISIAGRSNKALHEAAKKDNAH
jgi:hypothetical protein